MKLSLFDYHLPHERIAQVPKKPRDHSRLLVVERSSDSLRHDHFYNLPKYLRNGDVLVFNDTKVFKARLIGKKETGGKIEVFLLRPVRGTTWEALIGGKVRRVGQHIRFQKGLSCTVTKQLGAGVWHVAFNKTARQVFALSNRIGRTPTPPYIKESSPLVDYQTVYAKKTGSVAAPTAGFHFTKRLLAALKKKGVQFEYVTLHVGYGTFQPVKADDIRKHKMHSEYAEVSVATLKRLRQAKKEGRRIVAVGTTSVRVLETVGLNRRGFHGWINTFIYPGYTFTVVDAMVTNFHLPKSTLLMLVSAFAGRKSILHAYQTAVRKKYRFFSFGDGMLVL
ncbi:MAG: tRNA preQ1(34) S-adenosylmethionine ribosyltransferase-isomerase QueA [Patescibacteria group bacterium]|nr:tRNA preQ1(34) S-adenosylmethionine ribosyltransferase-isomerase QueA [Patescibacteria group bacterium]MDD5715657.1 tRNA preQ1(34) S-adenosylmethionine ribosyltransferase-isomerase QueA [Patescibacteria group bacterium]